MPDIHHFDIDSDNGDEIVMVCPHDACRRRIVISRSGRLVVIDRGDFSALHTGGTEGLRITTSVGI